VAQLSDLTEASYLEGLQSWSLDEVRARRDEATEIETALSYLRRIVQGRLDIVVAVQSRRQQGVDLPDMSQLVEQLPSILGEHVRAPGLGRLPALMAPGEIDHDLEVKLESILPASRLSHLTEMTDEELGECSGALGDFERSVSAQRRAVFDVVDRLQEEIVRRYRTGEATVDSLLP
jgi:RsiG-like